MTLSNPCQSHWLVQVSYSIAQIPRFAESAMPSAYPFYEHLRVSLLVKAENKWWNRWLRTKCVINFVNRKLSRRVIFLSDAKTIYFQCLEKVELIISVILHFLSNALLIWNNIIVSASLWLQGPVIYIL